MFDGLDMIDWLDTQGDDDHHAVRNEIERLRADVERLTPKYAQVLALDKENFRLKDQLSASEIANEEAEHRRRAAEKDAERYRWLRHGDNDELILMLYTTGGAYLPRNENLDVAIDAAVGKQHGT